MIKRITTTLAILLISIVSFAQSVDLAVSGVVYRSGGLPLSGVDQILLRDGESIDRSTTKPNGLFNYALDFEHQYELIVRKTGYQPQKVLFNTTGLSKEEKNFTYKLTRIRLTLEEGGSDKEAEVVQDFSFDHERGNFRNQQ